MISFCFSRPRLAGCLIRPGPLRFSLRSGHALRSPTKHLFGFSPDSRQTPAGAGPTSAAGDAASLRDADPEILPVHPATPHSIPMATLATYRPRSVRRGSAQGRIRFVVSALAWQSSPWRPTPIKSPVGSRGRFAVRSATSTAGAPRSALALRTSAEQDAHALRLHGCARGRPS